MIDMKFLEHIYQQWCSGQTNPAKRWLEFVELARRETGATQDDIILGLQKTTWFRWPRP